MKCPICGKPREDKHRPFCSKRCADEDMSRWLTGAYAIPVADEEEPSLDDDGPDGPRH
jgi:uncharacterized protein